MTWTNFLYDDLCFSQMIAFNLSFMQSNDYVEPMWIEIKIVQIASFIVTCWFFEMKQTNTNLPTFM
jgi:hypothetical protein